MQRVPAKVLTSEAPAIGRIDHVVTADENPAPAATFETVALYNPAFARYIYAFVARILISVEFI